mgnify:CR=1 FL=1
MLYPLLTLCIIAQLCASALFIMHKANFFHFLHKRENPSFLAFGQNDSFWLCRGPLVHIVYVSEVIFFMFSESICRFPIPMYDISRNNSDTVQIRVQQLYMFTPV